MPTIISFKKLTLKNKSQRSAVKIEKTHCEKTKNVSYWTLKVYNAVKLSNKKYIDADDKDTLILIVTASPSFAIKYCVSDLPVTVIGTEFIKTDYVFSARNQTHPSDSTDPFQKK